MVTLFPPVLQLRPECGRAPRWQNSYPRGWHGFSLSA